MPKRLRSASRFDSLATAMSSPKRRILPRVGAIAPIIRRSKVLLPHPEPPMMTSVSPRRTLRSSPVSTVWLPNCMSRSSTSMTTSWSGAGVCCGLLGVGAFIVREHDTRSAGEVEAESAHQDGCHRVHPDGALKGHIKRKPSHP